LGVGHKVSLWGAPVHRGFGDKHRGAEPRVEEFAAEEFHVSGVAWFILGQLPVGEGQGLAHDVATPSGIEQFCGSGAALFWGEVSVFVHVSVFPLEGCDWASRTMAARVWASMRSRNDLATRVGFHARCCATSRARRFTAAWLVMFDIKVSRCMAAKAASSVVAAAVFAFARSAFGARFQARFFAGFHR